MKSKLKIWCINETDQGLTEFLDKSLQNKLTRSVLESRYPEQLTLSYLLRNDFDRARYHLSLSVQSVLQVCIRQWCTSGIDIVGLVFTKFYEANWFWSGSKLAAIN